MKKLILSFALIFCALFGFAQQRYSLQYPKVRFYSDAPLEDIEAVNRDLKGIVDFYSRDFAFRIPIKSFVFERELMQEHFNENYMESNKFPNANFTGKITVGKYDLKKDGDYPLTVSGKMDIHGVVKEYDIPVVLSVKKGVISFKSVFKLKLVDHNIEVPNMVFQKIAEEIEVTVTAELLGQGK